MSGASAFSLFAEALDGGSHDALALRALGGEPDRLELARWLAPAAAADERLLHDARGPVLDVGCGPGRHVRLLQRRGIDALGVDASPAAVALARSRGTAVHEGSVFGDVPRAGQWRTALLLDGNVGIGGDPVALLDRVAQLLAPGGRVLVEVDAPGAGLRVGPVRLERGALVSRWFAWARVGAEVLEQLARPAGLRLVRAWDDDGRWFAELAWR